MLIKDIPAFSVSVAAFLFSLLGLYNTYRFAKKANKAKVLTDIFAETRRPEAIAIRRQLGEAYATGQPVSFDLYREYSFFLNHIGLLLHQGYVDVQDIYQLFGLSVTNAWKALSPAIMEIRARPDQSSYYQFHFQYLAAQLLAHKAKGNKRIEALIRKSAAKIKLHAADA